MDPSDRHTPQDRFRGRARLFRALANETRLFILDRISRGECCVCDLAELTGLDQSTVSKHLARLSSVGLVEGERRGHHVYYRPKEPSVAGWIDGRDTHDDKRQV